MMTGQLMMELGTKGVAEHNKAWVKRARAYAITLSRLHGSVSSDTLRWVAYKIGEPAHPNAWGTVFRNKGEHDGKWTEIGTTKSTWPSRRASLVRVWRWDPTPLPTPLEGER